jgi:hypothetical protein
MSTYDRRGYRRHHHARGVDADAAGLLCTRRGAIVFAYRCCSLARTASGSRRIPVLLPEAEIEARHPFFRPIVGQSFA